MPITIVGAGHIVGNFGPVMEHRRLARQEPTRHDRVEAPGSYARAVAGLKTMFASSYTQQISLSEALDIDTLGDYRRIATGEKYASTPHRT